MITIIHTADLHLGAEPDAGYAWADERREEIWDSLSVIVKETKKRAADFLLISGDLFHRQPTEKELKEVNYLFQTIPQTQVILIAGNHDCLVPGSLMPSYPWASNVHGLWGNGLEKISFPEKNIAFYGLSYQKREEPGNLYENAVPYGEEQYHILLAHGGDSKHSPMDWNRLKEAGFTYVAMGHIHKVQAIVKNRIIFCGSPEPLDRTEKGKHGYIRLLLEDEKISAGLFPCAVRSYLDAKVKVGEDTTQAALESILSDYIREKGEKNIYRFRLTGTYPVGMSFQTERLLRLGNVVDVIDETRPALDPDELSGVYRGTLLGAYIDHFRSMPDCPEDPVKEKALYYGMEALLNAEKKS